MFSRPTDRPPSAPAPAPASAPGPAPAIDPVPATTPEPTTAGKPDTTERPEDIVAERGSAIEVLLVAARLGLTCFGGPIAHLAYFRDEYVVKRRWLDDRGYADLVALSQFLPGAASSKVGMSIGILRAGLPGGLAAWIGFTLPSAIALAIAAIALRGVGGDVIGLMHGLKVVAVAVVAQAVWGMAKNLAPDRPRATIAVAAAIGVFTLPPRISQVAVIAIAGLIGWRFLRTDAEPDGRRLAVPIPRWLSVAAWIVLFTLLIGLPLLRSLIDVQAIAMTDSFYRAGAFVFGGGHVVLPLLQHEVVPHWISQDQALAGYGLAQAVPGPLFTYSAYLGAALEPGPNGALGAALALVAIFLPSVLLTLGALPLWTTVRTRPALQAALRGVNAAVVGILLAALYNPVFTSAIQRPADFTLGIAAFGLLMIWRCPPWLVVLVTAVVGALLAMAD